MPWLYAFTFFVAASCSPAVRSTSSTRPSLARRSAAGPARPREVLQVAPARQVAPEARLLDHRADLPQRAVAGRLPRRDRLAQHLDLARRREDQAERHADGRGLARAVRAEEPVQHALLDLKVERVDRGDAPVALRQPPRGDRDQGRSAEARSQRRRRHRAEHQPGVVPARHKTDGEERPGEREQPGHGREPGSGAGLLQLLEGRRPHRHDRRPPAPEGPDIGSARDEAALIRRMTRGARRRGGRTVVPGQRGRRSCPAAPLHIAPGGQLDPVDDPVRRDDLRARRRGEAVDGGIDGAKLTEVNFALSAGEARRARRPPRRAAASAMRRRTARPFRPASRWCAAPG